MRAIGLMIKGMVLATKSFIMATFTKENTKKEKFSVKEDINGFLVNSMMDNG